MTGGAGFIGSNFCDYILSAEDIQRLYIVDKFTYAGLPENLEQALRDSRCELVKGDICTPQTYQNLFKEIDLLINFAAESHVDNSILSPVNFVQTNIFGTFQLLEQIRRNNKSVRFVQISTDEVYGSLSFTDKSSTPQSTINPSSPYSASKAGADHLVLSYSKTYAMDVVVTRSSNNYGPRQLPEKFIPKIITHALQDKEIPLYGTGENIRD
ncbi:MAG: GDP-mannose 4,6-dehydratase, partial [Bdellovibrionales bacterium]|nr:GDP-mannose 4,6-dehydratase [Bdellovibrionales bacterium]